MGKPDELPMHFQASGQGFSYARALRREQTEAEKVLWKILRNNQLGGLKFRRQHPIGYFIADFYCHEFKLVIEVDGVVHEEAEQVEYDQYRNEWMADYGLTVLRFSNDDIQFGLAAVKERINQTISTFK